MDFTINISNLNDFVFCPASIYFHNLFDGQSSAMYEELPQVLGKKIHETIDNQRYSSSKDVLQGISVYSEQYNIMGKIDLYEKSTKHLIERKRQIKTIYDGYVFQVYAQSYCLTEMGHPVERISLRSYIDNKVYPIQLPDENREMKRKFFSLLDEMMIFSIESFIQVNQNKCLFCNYASVCDKAANYVE